MRRPTRGAVASVGRWSPIAVALVLPALLLGPALLPGYVLSYDMVWVPDLALRSDFLGVGSTLPRAVPSDALVSVLDQVVPGELLQKLVLYGALAAAGLGAQRLVDDRPVARLAAVTWAVWSPFVVERLWIGHWPLLWGYAAVLWLVVLAGRAERTGRVPIAAYFWIVLGSLSPSAGIASAVTIGVTAGGATRWRMLALSAAANLPWLVAGALHTSEARQVAGSAQFALGGEGSVPPWLAALSLGGIWNADVVPDSRQGVGGWLALGTILLLLVIGIVARRQASRDGPDRSLAVLWVLGYGAAVLTWAAPTLIAWLGATVPGLGVMRDGARALVLCVPLVVVLVGAAAVWLADRMRLPAARLGLATAVVLAPLALLPGAGGGIGGQLRPVDYPAEWSQVRAVVAELPAPGRVLVLPFTSYRAPAWNGGRPVLDPLGRFLTPNYVVNDELAVGGDVVPGEDSAAQAVRSALALGSPDVRAAALRELGIGLVVRDRTAAGAGVAPYDVPIEGRSVRIGASIEVQELGAVDVSAAPRLATAALVLAWLGLLGVLALGGLRGLIALPLGTRS